MYTGPSSAHDFYMRTFKPYDLDQPYLLPPDLRSWLSEGHLALFVSDVVDALDLTPILDDYERGDGRGYPPYHPVMMVKLLVYGYCTGKVSSRKIEKATWEDVAFRVLSGNQEAEAKAKAQAQAEEARERIAERERQEARTGKKIGGVPPRIPDPEKAAPESKAQKNFTDAESRIMLDGATKSFVQAFNAQIAVDAHAQIIVAAGVTQDAVDTRQLAPLLLAVEANTGRLPEVATADNGYFNPDAITDERLAGVDLYVATARERKSSPPVGDPVAVPLVATSAPAPITDAVPTTVVQQMRDKLATDLGRATYK